MRTERFTIFVVILTLALVALGLQTFLSEQLPDWADGLEYNSNEIFPIYVGEDGSAYISATFGGEPLALRFNTSEETGLSMTGRLVEQMGLPVSEEVYTSETGEEVLYRVPAFTAFGRRWTDQTVLPASDVRYNGSIGPQYLDGRRFTLDYAHQLLAVSESPMPENVAGANILPLESSDESLLPVVRGWVGDEEVLVEFDTGINQSVVDILLARKLGLLNGDGQLAPVDVSLGSFTISLADAGVKLLPITAELHRVRLGSDVLSSMVLTVDYQSGTMAIYLTEQGATILE